MALWKKVCCAVDFSESSRRALETAAALARDLGASLLVLHVTEEVVATLAPFAPPPVIRTAPEGSLQHLEEWVEFANLLAGGLATSVLLSGAPADQIVRFAQESGCDVIVLGTHGRGGVRRLLMGSVAEQVIRAANRPVVVVRQEGRPAHVGIPEALVPHESPMGPEPSGLP